MVRTKNHAEEKQSVLTVAIPPRKQWFTIALMTVILFAFLFTFVSDLLSSFARERHASALGIPIAIIIYTLLVIALLTWAIDLLWQFKGQEVLEITNKRLNLHHQIGSLRVSRSCELNKIQRFAILPVKAKHSKPAFFSFQDFLFMNFNYGRLELVYSQGRSGKPNTIRFGSALQEARARKLEALIKDTISTNS